MIFEYHENLRSLDQTVSDVASQQPNSLFVRDVSRTDAEISHTYGEANLLINHLARQLISESSPVVGVMLSTSYECICLIYAVMRAGKDVVLIDPDWGEHAQRSIARALGLSIVVADGAVTGVLSELQCQLDWRRTDGMPVPAEAAAGARIIIFTSGTTSKPKGIVLSQNAMIAAYRIGQRCLGVHQGTRVGCFYRVSGLGILGMHFLFPMLFGGSATILPMYAYSSGSRFWSSVRELGINFLYIVPPIANYLVKETAPLAHPFVIEELMCVAGSARLDPDIQRQFQRNFAPLANVYGLSECGFAFLFGHRQGPLFDNSVGSAVGLELKIADINGSPVTAPGVQGRLHVKTKSMFEGYLHNDALTHSVVNNGWLDTQDIAFFDVNGCVNIIGRVDNTIKKAGNLFHLVECEEALTALDCVVEAACVKVPCDIYGEDYVAIVRPKAVAEVFAYDEYLARTLGVARAPKYVVFTRDELPRNGAGKYDKNGLLKLAVQ
jgi:long-chain acyl-CoA synthetase